MNLRDETNTPLWVERFDLYSGAELSPVERALEELDSPNGWPVASSPSSAAGQPLHFERD